VIHLLLAAYNEGKALGNVLEKAEQSLSGQPHRVWVVDDGSSDNTANVAREWAKRIPLTLLRHPQNMGLGKALQTGLSQILPALAATDVLGIMDADNTQPPELLPVLVQRIQNNEADVVIASRFIAGGKSMGVPLFRRFTSAAARVLFRLFFHIPNVQDYTCGYRVYRGELLLRAKNKWGVLLTEDGFAATVELLVKLSAFSPRVAEVPLLLRYDRKPTPSKMPVFRTILKSLLLLRRLKKAK